MALRTKVPFVENFEIFRVPTGKRVKSIQVVQHEGVESIEVLVEEIPVALPLIVGSVLEFNRP